MKSYLTLLAVCLLYSGLLVLRDGEISKIIS
jgi:hypothetical protein